MIVGSWAQTIHPNLYNSNNCTGTYSRNFIDCFSFTRNQAALSSLRTMSIGIIADKKFSIADLNTYMLVMSLAAAGGAVGIQANYFGSADYNESKFGLAYGRKLGKATQLGIQFDYNQFKIASYGNASAINFESGVIFFPNEKIAIGLHVFNPVGGKFGKHIDEKLASRYSFGVGYES